MFVTVFEKLDKKENPKEYFDKRIELEDVPKFNSYDDRNIEEYLTSKELAFNKKVLTLKFENIDMIEDCELEVFNFKYTMYKDLTSWGYKLIKRYVGSTKEPHYIINDKFYISVEDFNNAKSNYINGQKEMYAPTVEVHNHNSTHHTSETNFINLGGDDYE